LTKENKLLPAQGLLLALVYVVALATLCTWQALQAPWLGLKLKPQGEHLLITQAQGPSALLNEGHVLEAIRPSANTPWFPLKAGDTMEEPDLLPGYPELDAFFERQGEIKQIIDNPVILIRTNNPETNETSSYEVTPGERPVSSLPTIFWFQILICSLGCLIAVWVWVLQPQELGARMFGITGLLFPAFVLPAAIYSSRELALGEHLFYALSAANHLGSKMFGSAFVGIFMMHPIRLINIRWLYGLFLLMFAWWIINAGRLVDSMDIGLRAAILLLLLLSFWFGFQQWRQSKGKPLQRASLRWLVLSLLVGTSLYIFLFTASAALGWITAIPQGYAFGFFLLIYIGIALGIGRYRLFDLDVWAYRLLLWLAATLAVVLLDALLIVSLDWSQGFALGVSLWICGVLYFPIRQWLWHKLVSRNTPQLNDLLPELLKIAFSHTPQQRSVEWKQLLRNIYSPLQVAESSVSVGQAALVDGGTSLQIPACADMPSLQLTHRANGKQLFSSVDLRFIDALVNLMNKAESARASKEQGAIEERRRITRDIHDDVGARLLMLIHSSENPQQAELARAAMDDLRGALSNIDGKPLPLMDAAADWRDEANQRCDAAKIHLHWADELGDSSRMLAPRLKTLLQRVLRESITNAIKHGQPTTISVHLGLSNNDLTMTVEHDGQPSDPAQWVPGMGMQSLKERLSSCKGSLNIESNQAGLTKLTIFTPLGEE